MNIEEIQTMISDETLEENGFVFIARINEEFTDGDEYFYNAKESLLIRVAWQEHRFYTHYQDNSNRILPF